MREINLLSRKEIKELCRILKGQFGFEYKFEHAVLMNKDGDVFIANKSLFDVDLPSLKIDAFGLYIGELKNGQFRLSMDGCQFFGPLASKNVVDVSFDEMRKFLHGEELIREKECDGYVILKHDGDFIACSRFKDGKLLNFVPKTRRIKTPD